MSQKNEKLDEEFVQNQEKIEEEYDKLEEEYIAKETKVLVEDEEKEFKKIYLSLIGRFHPDKSLKHKENYEKMSKIINSAKEKQDLQLLKDIQSFPERYFGGVLPEQQDDKLILANFVGQLQDKLAELEDQIDLLQTQEGLKLYQMWENNQTKFIEFLAERKTNLEEKIKHVRDEITKIKLHF